MKIYFASPWFTAAQLERETRLIKRLRELGFEVFSPREASNISGSFADEGVQKSTFENNIVNIDDCDILFGVTDGKLGICTEPDKNGKHMNAADSGTMFEIGYAYNLSRKNGKPYLVYYAETLGNAPFNLMLAQSGDIIITKYEDLDNLPMYIENLKSGEKVKYVGRIE